MTPKALGEVLPVCSHDHMCLKILPKADILCAIVNGVSFHSEFLSYIFSCVRGVGVAVGIHNQYSLLDKYAFGIHLSTVFFLKEGPYIA